MEIKFNRRRISCFIDGKYFNYKKLSLLLAFFYFTKIMKQETLKICQGRFDLPDRTLELETYGPSQVLRCLHSYSEVQTTRFSVAHFLSENYTICRSDALCCPSGKARGLLLQPAHSSVLVWGEGMQQPCEACCLSFTFHVPSLTGSLWVPLHRAIF